MKFHEEKEAPEMFQHTQRKAGKLLLLSHSLIFVVLALVVGLCPPGVLLELRIKESGSSMFFRIKESTAGWICQL